MIVFCSSLNAYGQDKLVDTTHADSILESILTSNKGKLIFIDFWATWCGPCIKVINELKPLKRELAEEDIAFVYISSPSSRSDRWDSMKAGISGQHYRMNGPQWDQFSKKFGIVSIPFQVLIDRQGEIVKTNVRFSELKWYRQFFKEELAK